MLNLFRKIPSGGESAKIGLGVTFGRDVKLGHWTKIGRGAAIGENVTLGEWSGIGAGARIGNNAEIGDWVKIGAGAIIGAGSVLPGHVRVRAGVEIMPGTILEGHELVTSTGIIPHRTGGYATGHDGPGGGPVSVSGPFGRFEVPEREFDPAMIEEYQWGISEALERYRVDAPAADATREGEDLETPEP